VEVSYKKIIYFIFRKNCYCFSSFKAWAVILLEGEKRFQEVWPSIEFSFYRRVRDIVVRVGCSGARFRNSLCMVVKK